MATLTVGATTITFRMLLDGADFERTAQVTTRHIPGGDIYYIDSAGLNAPTLNIRARVDSYADLISLQTMQGVSASLVYSEATYTVILQGVKQAKPLGRAGIRFVQLDFVLIV